MHDHSRLGDDHCPAIDVLRALHERYPTVPLLALGQTIWWDEPMKVVIPRLLEEAGIRHDMVLGIHDTDYFAKAHGGGTGESRFELLPHNDGRTRELWSAAGEISRLFGAECLPTRRDLTRYGVPLRALLRERGAARQAFLDAITEAWGWRGLVHRGSDSPVVCEMRLEDVLPGIRTMLEYGFDQTIASIETPEIARQARAYASALVAACCDCCRSDPAATLTTLYKKLYPTVLRLLAGRAYSFAAITSTSELLRFSPATCSLPRFDLLNVFLRTETRRLAEEAYNAAVAGSEMYTLDKFGPGALPFDVVVPGIGRGTLRVTVRGVHIDARDPVLIRTGRLLTSVSELAEVLASCFGDRAIVVGKAVTLISMLSREFMFVFNEEGSAYVWRTRAMHDRLSRHGVPCPAYPILRLHYRTWDSAEGVATVVSLPEPMRRPFGRQTVPMSGFASCWRGVVEEEHRSLEQLRGLRSVRRLLAYLHERCPGRWACAVRRYSEITQQLVERVQQQNGLWTEARSLHAELRRLREEIARTEQASGAHFRGVAQWTPEEIARREAFAARLHELRDARRAAAHALAANRKARLAFGRQPQVAALRRERREIEIKVEETRLELVRGALITTRSLVHADHRPTAWWLPFVDPSGGWFERVSQTATAYTEPLVSD